MKHWKTVIKAACLSLALSSTSVLAEFKPVAHFGFEFGGDNVLEVNYLDGSSSTISAGDGIVFAAGAAYLLNPEITLQATLGWKYQTIKQSSNGDADFTRFPLETTIQYMPTSNLRIGAGTTYHLNPKLSVSGLATTYSPNRSFDNALGTVLQLDYITEAGLIYGARYTDLTYTDSNTSEEVDGSSMGIHLIGMF